MNYKEWFPMLFGFLWVMCAGAVVVILAGMFHA